jgi:adenylate cyclase, class 2
MSQLKSATEEIEVKFCLTTLKYVRSDLEGLGARLIHARVLERNIRFDNAAHDLQQSSRVLRLRQDTSARLTYKGPGEIREGVLVRQEIEFTVEDFGQAQAFLEALGYHASVVYEKYRTTYALESSLVTLDELPYGFFSEIEGHSPGEVASAAQKLRLPWEARINEGYIALFERVRQALRLPFRDLTFENFRALTVSAGDLGVRFADDVS